MILKIYLTESIGNSVKTLDKIQELFGGNIARKPNHFGYFFRAIIESMSDNGEIFEKPRISVESNRYDSRNEFESELKLFKTN